MRAAWARLGTGLFKCRSPRVHNSSNSEGARSPGLDPASAARSTESYPSSSACIATLGSSDVNTLPSAKAAMYWSNVIHLPLTAYVLYHPQDAERPVGCMRKLGAGLKRAPT